MNKPSVKPNNPCFSSGPTSKRPGWDINNLNTQVMGRSHRSKLGKERLQHAINLQREILGIPDDYLLGIVPASDTGAVEMAMWSLLGQRGVDILAWESFGSGWVTDAVKQLKLEDINTYTADYGQLPDLSKVDCNRDIVFTYNGTTSGVKVPNGDWIDANRTGLTICDATSAVFAMDMPWDKLDVTTYSWQKVLGGEAAHGVIILSPRAVERLQTYNPAWPLPKIFRLTKKGELIKGIFTGATINTPSMLAVEDAIDVLEWAKSIGGLQGLIKRSQNNLAVLQNWVANTPWASFLAEDEANLSNTSVCLKIANADAAQLKELTKILEAENVAYDIGAYRDAPAGLRIWCGSTVEANDVKALLPWLEWGYANIINS